MKVSSVTDASPQGSGSKSVPYTKKATNLPWLQNAPDKVSESSGQQRVSELVDSLAPEDREGKSFSDVFVEHIPDISQVPHAIIMLNSTSAHF